MVRIAGLASNRGDILMHVHDRVPGGATVAVVVASEEDAPVLDAGAERGIPTEVVVEGDGSRTQYGEQLREVLTDYEFDLVCLDGHGGRIPDDTLETLPTTLDAHPSLWPAFAEANAVTEALDAGVRVTGSTVHVVTADGTDPIVTQEPVPVYQSDDPTTLHERIKAQGERRAYPRAVRWFAEDRVTVDETAGSVVIDGDEGGTLPSRWLVSADYGRELRYGENPHQTAALYVDSTETEASVVGAPQLNEGARALSYNNYNDADGALELIKEFDRPAAAVIKHTNPAGCATAGTIADAYDRALATDPMSAFGGIVALNRECDVATAEHITESFKEVVVAPGYTDAALEVLFEKENLRVLEVDELGDQKATMVERPLTGGRLVQDRDLQRLTADDLEVVTDRDPTDEQIESMLFAWQVAKHVKSNAIVFATSTETVGIGAGQMSRVDAVRIARMKADEHAEGKSAAGGVMASDAFFPFPDGIEAAAEAGIEAVIQPGGSVNDEDVIAATNDLDMTMVFTGQRCFRHN